MILNESIRSIIETNKLNEIGIMEYACINPSDIVFSDDVRKICEGNQCRKYGTTWTCPPGVGTVEECRSKCLKYSKALVLASTYELEDSFDYEGMIEGQKSFKEACYRLSELLTAPYLLLANEGCQKCESCTYPDAPCRFPNLLMPAVESYGILVTELAKSAEILYKKGTNSVTYFGLLCFD